MPCFCGMMKLKNNLLKELLKELIWIIKKLSTMIFQNPTKLWNYYLMVRGKGGPLSPQILI